MKINQIMWLLTPILTVYALLLPACRPNIQPPALTPPETPSMWINPTADEPNRIMQLLIQDNSDNEDGFTIERKTTGENYSHLADSPSNAELYNDIGVAKSTQYAYRIRAFNKSGNSDWYEATATSVGTQTSSKTVYAIADAFVDQGAAGYPSYSNNNYGTEDYVEIGSQLYSTVTTSYGLVLFQLPPIPSYSTGYKSAKLILHDASGGNSSYNVPIEVYAFLNLNSWGETTVTYNTRPGTLLSDGNGFLGHVVVASDDAYNHVHTILMDITNLASYWYSSKLPNYGANYGLTLYIPGTGVYWSFYSREFYPTGGCANLVVSYDW